MTFELIRRDGRARRLRRLGGRDLVVEWVAPGRLVARGARRVGVHDVPTNRTRSVCIPTRGRALVDADDRCVLYRRSSTTAGVRQDALELEPLPGADPSALCPQHWTVIPPWGIVGRAMEHSAHTHHEMPTSGRALTSVALSATLHCLTGCAIGEVLGMIIGTALGFSDAGTIALAVGLAFLFGYALTSLPLLRAGLALSAVVPIALASDTLSIAVMEIVDNGIMLAIPGAMEAGVGNVLFWGALAFALVIAGAVALPVNRWLIARGKGHAVVHETGIHGGPSPRVVGAAAAVAFVFGAAVLIGEVASGGSQDDPAPHGARVEHR